MNLKNLENEIFELEGIRVILRSCKLKKFQYPYQRKCSDNVSIFDFIQTRINSLAEGVLDAVIVDGYGNIPNSRTHVGTVRATYQV